MITSYYIGVERISIFTTLLRERVINERYEASE